MPDDPKTNKQTLKLPQENIPATKQERNRLLKAVREYIGDKKLVGPLSIEELRVHSEKIIARAELDEKYTDFAAVLISNELWRGTIAATPYDKRLLLLPKCFRDHRNCPAAFDELGLLCENCGRCLNDEFKAQAEELGYAVLIAEGSPVVMSMVKTGQIEAVVGVSCMSVLENVFPYMEAGAIPGIAIPLLYDGCANTTVDVEWVWEAIYENSTEPTGMVNIEQLRSEVDSWFTEESLAKLLGDPQSQVEKLALKWLTRAGKRWRPFLTAAICDALDQDSGKSRDGLTATAVAVECFHKASLIHDDIEDGDSTRYGQKTLHAEFGVPIALNVGDFLLGQGYDLLSKLDVGEGRRLKMLSAAAEGHRALCIGQGKELAWLREPELLSSEKVIEIFRQKTAPAFDVALKLGAYLAGCGDSLTEILTRYSRALGVGYQIRDDIDDFQSDGQDSRIETIRPSLLFALAGERAKGAQKELINSIWTSAAKPAEVSAEIETIFGELKIRQAATEMMEACKAEAMCCLTDLDSIALKSLLRRVISKIFNDIPTIKNRSDSAAS